MGKVIIHTTMSLDGFIAVPHNEMDWVFKYDSDKMVDKIMKEIGAVVLGKRTFDISLEINQLSSGGVLKGSGCPALLYGEEAYPVSP